MGPEDKSSKRSWISGVWDWYKLSGNSKAKSTYSPLSTLSSKLRSTGLERPRGKVVPGVQDVWLDASGLRVLAGVENAFKAVWTELDTISSMVECWAELNEVFYWLSVLISTTDLIMSSMEDSEAWSDRALSSCSCSWLALFCRRGKVSVYPVLRWSRLFLVDRPVQALTCNWLDIHFCCLLLAVLLRSLAALPSRAHLRQFWSCPLEPVIRFRASSWSFKTSLLSPERSSTLMGIRFVWDARRRQWAIKTYDSLPQVLTALYNKTLKWTLNSSIERI